MPSPLIPSGQPTNEPREETEYPEFGAEYFRVLGQMRTRFGLILNGKNVPDLATVQQGIIEVVTAGGHRFTALAHKGGRTMNDDRVVINTERDIGTVVDGHGTNGAYAAALFSAKLLQADILTAAREAMSAMQTECRGAGTCFGRIDVRPGLELEPSMAGDVKIIVMDAHGKLVFESVDQNETQDMVLCGQLRPDQAPYHNLRHKVTNSISPYSDSATVLPRIAAQKGWRFLIYSDGVSDNLVAREVRDLIYTKGTGHMPARQAIATLEAVIQRRISAKSQIVTMTGDRAAKQAYSDGYVSTPRDDNRAVLIGDLV